jgi:hypothetical protein
MANISFKFNEEFIAYLKSIGARWDPQAKVWAVPETKVSEVEAKAKELNVQKLKIDRKQAAAAQAPKPVEGVIRMRKSKDGRFVLISMNLIAFTEDVKQMLYGERQNVRFKVLPPKPIQQQQQIVS